MSYYTLLQQYSENKTAKTPFFNATSMTEEHYSSLPAHIQQELLEKSGYQIHSKNHLPVGEDDLNRIIEPYNHHPQSIDYKIKK